MFRFLHQPDRALRPFLILWSTQTFSALGSAMTGYALLIWSYRALGSALGTAMLAVCTYAPYVALSIFAGALSDRWDPKKTMLVGDTLAALCTVGIGVLYVTGALRIWHLYGLNFLLGLFNTVQQPASDVAVTLLTPKSHVQRVCGLRSLGNAAVTLLTPAAASALLAFAGLPAVLWFDLGTFAMAFLALLLRVRIPQRSPAEGAQAREPLSEATRAGLRYLRGNPGVLHLILFLALINLIASMYNAALPAMLLSRQNGGDFALGAVNTVTGLATVLGGILTTLLPAPKSRVRLILNALLFSMSFENFLLAFGRSPIVWCVAAVLGWIAIPAMGANMDALLRLRIPVTMQGRVYAARNTLQFFTIPVGNLLGGLLVDRVFEPLMAAQANGGLLPLLFGTGKGSGAAALYACLGVLGVLSCLPFRRDAALWALETPPQPAPDAAPAQADPA